MTTDGTIRGKDTTETEESTETETITIEVEVPLEATSNAAKWGIAEATSLAEDAIETLIKQGEEVAGPLLRGEESFSEALKEIRNRVNDTHTTGYCHAKRGRDAATVEANHLIVWAILFKWWVTNGKAHKEAIEDGVYDTDDDDSDD